MTDLNQEDFTRNTNKIRGFYIGTGEKSMMYTLHFAYEEDRCDSFEGKTWFYTVIVDHYYGNLASEVRNGFDRAYAKACKIAGNLAHTIPSTPFTLEEITRRTREQLEAEKTILWEGRQVILNEIAEAKRASKYAPYLEQGLFPFGKYEGIKIVEVAVNDVEYCRYLLSKEVDQNLPQSVRMASEAIRSILAPIIAEAPVELVRDEYLSEIGKRIDIKAKIKRGVNFETQWGWITIFTMLTDDGFPIVYKGATEFPEEPEADGFYYFKATIKDHSEYNDAKQTVVSRLKFTTTVKA